MDAVVRQCAAAALWSSLLLVTYWWLTGRGAQDLGRWASGLTSLGRISGLAGSVLLLAQVVLMARVPLLEKASGQDRLARVHRVVGFTSFTLVLAHIGTVTWGYAAGALSQVPAMLWSLAVGYPGRLLAVAGSAALFGIVGTSTKQARRRLRYESWHLLHLYAYLGVGLALPHQLWTGPRDDQINAYALPILSRETTQAQSAQIDMVSGATVTSAGYLQSLQSALDKGNL